MLAKLLTEREETAASGRPRYLSHSRINRYLLCPEKYRLYYIERLRPVMPSASLVFGQVIHQSVAALLQKQADPLTYFQDTWGMLEKINLAYKERESWDKLKVCGEGLLKKFVTDELPKIRNVRAVEKPFELAITSLDLPFVGIIDLKADVSGKATVVDFKTAGSAFDPHEVILSDQLSAYNLAEAGVERLALCVLVKTKEPRIEWHFTTRTGHQLTEYIAKAGYVAREISAGRFFKRPGFWCSWCDYLPVCVGDEKKADETLVRVE